MESMSKNITRYSQILPLTVAWVGENGNKTHRFLHSTHHHLQLFAIFLLAC